MSASEQSSDSAARGEQPSWWRRFWRGAGPVEPPAAPARPTALGAGTPSVATGAVRVAPTVQGAATEVSDRYPPPDDDDQNGLRPVDDDDQLDDNPRPPRLSDTASIELRPDRADHTGRAPVAPVALPHPPAPAAAPPESPRPARTGRHARRPLNGVRPPPDRPDRSPDQVAASAARLGVGVGGPPVAVEVIEDGNRRYINRELSTLDFNRRVLALAASARQPLLERLKYLAIFSSNTDEFFQVRVAGLKDQQAAGVAGTAPDGLSVHDQLQAIRVEVSELLTWRHHLLFDEVLPALGDRGVRLVDWDDLDEESRGWLSSVFEDRVFPVLTPLAVDPGHPFPYISNLSLNLAVIVRDPAGGDRRFARLKVPPLLPGFVALPDNRRFVAVEQVIAAHLEALFPGMEIESHHLFRVTRNVDLALEEDEADDLLVAVETELRRRRFGRAVRLEVEASITDEVRELLTRELDLGPDDVYDIAGPLDLTGLWALHDIDHPELKDEPYVPIVPPPLAGTADQPADCFAAIRAGDILVHHPYDSFAMSVEAFIAQASRDPDVLAIKQTLYRTSGDSPVVRSLIRAAERGKQVAALVELKARGDEAANIGWARALERAGVHVVYGLVGLKTHSKTALVVRQESDGIRRYCHIGTGNYNPTTARLYEDLGVLTTDPALGADLTDLFNHLTGYSRRVDYRRLIVAPTGLRPRMVELIARETALGPAGRIVLKVNSLVDQEIIDCLYEASEAGVQIDLLTRSICCLRPGVPGLSVHIQVRSLVGRWLEHSRIFYFGHGASRSDLNGDADTDGDSNAGALMPDGIPVGRASLPMGGEYYIGSADLMERNLDRRVEAVIPVPRALTPRLREILLAELSDDVLAWELSGDGTWAKVPETLGFDAQVYCQEAATARDRRRREQEARLTEET